MARNISKQGNNANEKSTHQDMMMRKYWRSWRLGAFLPAAGILKEDCLSSGLKRGADAVSCAFQWFGA
jgi:hypothetical protein